MWEISSSMSSDLMYLDVMFSEPLNINRIHYFSTPYVFSYICIFMFLRQPSGHNATLTASVVKHNCLFVFVNI